MKNLLTLILNLIISIGNGQNWDELKKTPLLTELQTIGLAGRQVSSLYYSCV